MLIYVVVICNSTHPHPPLPRAPINSIDSSGNTALYLCCISSSETTRAELVLEHGAPRFTQPHLTESSRRSASSLTTVRTYRLGRPEKLASRMIAWFSLPQARELGQAPFLSMDSAPPGNIHVQCGVCPRRWAMPRLLSVSTAD